MRVPCAFTARAAVDFSGTAELADGFGLVAGCGGESGGTAVEAEGCGGVSDKLTGIGGGEAVGLAIGFSGSGSKCSIAERFCV